MESHLEPTLGCTFRQSSMWLVQYQMFPLGLRLFLLMSGWFVPLQCFRFFPKMVHWIVLAPCHQRQSLRSRMRIARQEMIWMREKMEQLHQYCLLVLRQPYQGTSFLWLFCYHRVLLLLLPIGSRCPIGGRLWTKSPFGMVRSPCSQYDT